MPTLPVLSGRQVADTFVRLSDSGGRSSDSAVVISSWFARGTPQLSPFPIITKWHAALCGLSSGEPARPSRRSSLPADERSGPDAIASRSVDIESHIKAIYWLVLH